MRLHDCPRQLRCLVQQIAVRKHWLKDMLWLQIWGYWNSRAPTCRQLYLYSDADAIISDTSVEEFASAQVSPGRGMHKVLVVTICFVGAKPPLLHHGLVQQQKFCTVCMRFDCPSSYASACPPLVCTQALPTSMSLTATSL